jgi:hypothetical protein
VYFRMNYLGARKEAHIATIAVIASAATVATVAAVVATPSALQSQSDARHLPPRSRELMHPSRPDVGVSLSEGF